MNYGMYPLLIPKALRIAARSVKNKHERTALRRNTEFVGKAITRLLTYQGAGLSAVVTVDEMIWGSCGSQIVFPESVELAAHLATMNIDITQAELDLFPYRSFMVCWPKGTTCGGVPLSACLVSYGSANERAASLASACKKLGMDQIELVSTAPETRFDTRVLHLCKPGIGPAGDYLYRVSVPMHMLEAALSGADQMRATVGDYNHELLNGALNTPLTPEQHAETWAMLKAVTRLMVYTIACPDRLVAGFPLGFQVRSDPEAFRGSRPQVLREPPRRTSTGGRNAPSEHWRDAHYRRYPIREDGSRRPGVIRIAQTYVGRPVGPHTVLKDAPDTPDRHGAGERPAE